MDTFIHFPTFNYNNVMHILKLIDVVKFEQWLMK